MTGPSTPLDLDAIRARYDKIKSGPPRLGGFNALRSARDVPDLLAEVEQLRAELTMADRRIVDINERSIPLYRHAHLYGLVDDCGNVRTPSGYLVDGEHYRPGDVEILYRPDGEVPDASS